MAINNSTVNVVPSGSAILPDLIGLLRKLSPNAKGVASCSPDVYQEVVLRLNEFLLRSYTLVESIGQLTRISPSHDAGIFMDGMGQLQCGAAQLIQSLADEKRIPFPNRPFITTAPFRNFVFAAAWCGPGADFEENMLSELARLCLSIIETESVTTCALLETLNETIACGEISQQEVSGVVLAVSEWAGLVSSAYTCHGEANYRLKNEMKAA